MLILEWLFQLFVHQSSACAWHAWHFRFDQENESMVEISSTQLYPTITSARMTGTEAWRRPVPSNTATKKTQPVSNRLARQQVAPPSLEKDGFRSKTARGALITTSLPSLQNLVKRTPDAYAEETQVQWNRFTR
jgi:hypothetical protein